MRTRNVSIKVLMQKNKFVNWKINLKNFLRKYQERIKKQQ